MAEWAATGDTDWNTKYLAYLAVEHNTDGTHSIHNAEGGYMQVDVNGTKTNVYTKYFTGTLDADASTSVAHGITGIDNILACKAIVFSTTSLYEAQTRGDLAAYDAYRVSFDATNVIIADVGASFQSQKYRIKIDYIL